MPRYYDNTRLSDFKDCPRKYYLRHERHLSIEGIAMPLVFGLSWHDAMDVVWGLAQTDKSNQEIVKLAFIAFHKQWVEQGLPPYDQMSFMDQDRWLPRTPGVAAEMLNHYVEQRRPYIQSCEILAIERPFAVPLLMEDDTFYIGRLDKLVKSPEGIYFIEHKTTSAYAKATGFRADYLNSWSPNSQIDGYLHAAKMLEGLKARGGLIDAALVHKQVHDKFKFIPIERQFAHIEGWVKETEAWIAQVEESKAILRETQDINRAFPKNTNSCYGKYGPCIFTDLCRFVADPTQQGSFEGYIEQKWEPFNILKLEQIGMEDEDAKR